MPTIKLGIPIDSASAIAIRSLLLIRWSLPLPAAKGVEVGVGVDELAKDAELNRVEIEVDSEEDAELNEIDIGFDEDVEFKDFDVESDKNVEANEVEIEGEGEVEEDAEFVYVDVDFEEVSNQDHEISQDVLQFTAGT